MTSSRFLMIVQSKDCQPVKEVNINKQGTMSLSDQKLFSKDNQGELPKHKKHQLKEDKQEEIKINSNVKDLLTKSNCSNRDRDKLREKHRL